MSIQALLESNSSIGLTTIFLYLSITLALTSIIFIVYKLTFTGVAYSNNFNVSIVLTGLITAMIMMVIGNNLALSLGMVGALSIVRFRAAIKEPKDISYLFWSIAIGLAAGTGAWRIAIAGTVFITLVIVMYYFLPDNNKAYLLVLKGSGFDDTAVRNVISDHTKKAKLRIKNSKNDKKEIIYEISVKKNDEELIKNLKEITGLEQVNVIAFDGHLNE